MVTGEWYIPGHKLRGFQVESVTEDAGVTSNGEAKVETTGMHFGEFDFHFSVRGTAVSAKHPPHGSPSSVRGILSASEEFQMMSGLAEIMFLLLWLVTFRDLWLFPKRHLPIKVPGDSNTSLYK
ncbi:unnamed protein product [Microthlaspi erraticum]|uniref:Uncharacterized protein n=1 Tax=Microthlaspi erraticum TaxID=1685480 RepID=A0A6D2KI14_9BRAS|nr:unnamed protein product [Microthlaspi erraticum]